MSEKTQEHIWDAPRALHPLNAQIVIPGSKSLSNRYLILAALSQEAVSIEGILRSRDTQLMMNALESLGVHCQIQEDQPTTVTVTPPKDGVLRGNTNVYCGLAGTVMRFVAPLALFADGPVHFDGDEQAYQRPMKPVLDGLEQLGATITYHGKEGFLPYTITPPKSLPDNTVHITIDSSQSSQFVSGLLLIASRLPHGMILHHEGSQLPSMPHIRMTMSDVTTAGGSITMDHIGTWQVSGKPLQLPQSLAVEPDLSNAAPFLGAALIAGGQVSIPYWPCTTTQPGGQLPQMLKDFGAEVTWNGQPWHYYDAIEKSETTPQHALLTVRSNGNIHGLGVYDMSQVGEIAPSIAAIAVFADIPTQLTGIAHLRGHETNRLEALVTQINRIGGRAQETADGILIEPLPPAMLHGTIMQSYEDHRMATFAAMIGLLVPNVRVENIETTKKTIPDFPGMWKALLASVQE